MDSLRLIHAKGKEELAKLIVTCAPLEASKFRIARRVPPSGWLVDYKPPVEGLSIRQLAIELGLLAEEEKPSEAEWFTIEVWR